MSSTAPAPDSDHLIPVHEAARILGGSPRLYIALIEGGLIEGQLIDGEWRVDAAVVGEALAVRERTNLPPSGSWPTCTDAAQGHPAPAVDGAA